MKTLLLTAVMTLFLSLQADASVRTVSGVIGNSDLTYNANTIAPYSTQTFAVDPGSKVLRIREVYPDAPDQPRYTYDVTVGGRLVYKRDYIGKGFGAVSFFIYLPEWTAKTKSLMITNRGKKPARIIDVQSVDEKKLQQIEESDSFGLLGLIAPHRTAEETKELLDLLSKNLAVKPGFYRGFSSEVRYAGQSTEQVSKTLDLTFGWAKERNLALLLSPVSWWSGTPLRIPDGEGGQFGDLKYQQICWSSENYQEDNPKLKELLGDRWDPRYCQSVPNQWANTPWLTMNSPTLNAYRYRRLEECIKMIADRSKSSGVNVKGLVLENEPRYWDTGTERGNKKREKKLETLWADFNPLTVADAAKDKVNLDPKDGLDREERLWLLRNVARYNQEAADCANKALASCDLSPVPDVYTHSLQHDGFPGDTINHPMSEFAYAKGAYTGLEVMWSFLSEFDRIREWGPWANVNREENDGQHIDHHLWDLRVTYARGGELYNSYNWHRIGADRFFAYVKEFLDNLPAAEVKYPQINQESSTKVSFATTMSVKGVNRVKCRISASGDLPSSIFALVKDSKGRTMGFSRIDSPFRAGEQEVEFIFSEPFELGNGERGTLEIVSEKKTDVELNIKGASFQLDLRRERNQSLFICSQKP